ncbi:hypothetical protein TCAL_15430 [Tigriopus californicus]|uniref:Uncharacterized protein n=1 Tax=Tigriopus californicus TaxID=6832 RepID=A0A553PRC5_TIGCA|nr:hypothetical protein TCAL_15430 [Tigriopus californicus]
MDPPPSNVEDLRQNLLVAAYQRFASPKAQEARGAHRSGSIEGSEGGLAPHLRIVDVYSLNEGPASFPIELTSDFDGSLEVERGDLVSISDHERKPEKKEKKEKKKAKENEDKDFESQRKDILECMLRKERDVVSYETKKKKKKKKEKKREQTENLPNDGMAANVMNISNDSLEKVQDEGRTNKGKKKRKRLYDAHVGEPLEISQDSQSSEAVMNENIGQLASHTMAKKTLMVPPDENVPDEGVKKKKKSILRQEDQSGPISHVEVCQKKKKNKNESGVVPLGLCPVEENDRVLNEAIIQKVKKGKNNIFDGEPLANVQIQQSETAPKDNATQSVKESQSKKKKKSEKDRVDIAPDDEEVILEDAPFKHPLEYEPISLKTKKSGQRKKISECDLIEKPNPTPSKLIENEASENLPDILSQESIENNKTIRKKKKKKKRSKGVQEWEISDFTPSEKSMKESINHHSPEAPGQDAINLSGVEEPPLKKKKKKKSKDRADNDPLENPSFTLSEEWLPIANKNRSGQGGYNFKTSYEVQEPPPLKKKKKKKSKDRTENDTLVNPASPEEPLSRTKLTKKKKRSQETAKDVALVEIVMPEELSPIKKKKKKLKERIQNDTLKNPNPEMDETPTDVCVRLKKPKQVTSKDSLENESLVSVAKKNKTPLEAPKRKKKAKKSIEIPIEIEGEPAKKMKKSEGRTVFEFVTNQPITEKNKNQTDDEASCKPREKFHNKMKKKKKTKEKNKIPTEHELISGEEPESNTDNGLTKKKKRKTKALVHEDSTEPPEKKQKKAIGTHETIPPEESQSLGNVSLGCVMEPIDPKKKKKKKKKKNVSKENQDETMGWGSISRIENPKRTEQMCALNQSIEDPMSDPNMKEGGTKNNASMESNANPKLFSNSETRTGNESNSLEGADRVGHSNKPDNQSVGSVEHVDSMIEGRIQKEVVEENRAPSNCVNPETGVDNQDASQPLGSVENGSVHMEQSISSNAESRLAIEKPDQTCDSMEHGPTSVEQRMELSTSSSQDTKMTNVEPTIPLIERLPEREPLTEVQDVEQPSISFSASASSNTTIDQGRLVKTPKRVPGPSKSEQVTFEPETADSISDNDTIRGRLDEVVKGLCIGSSSDYEPSLSSYRSSNSSSPQSVLLNEDERSDPNAEPLAVPNTPPDAIDAEPDAVDEPVEENEEASQSIIPKNVAQERSVIEGYQDSSDEEPVISRTRSDWQAADGQLNEVWNRFNERLDNETALNPPTDPKTPASNSEGVTDEPDDDNNTFEHLAEKRRKHREKIAQGSSLKKYRFRADTILEDLLSISDSEEIPNHSVAKPTPRDIKETLPLDAVIKLPTFKSQSFPSVAKMVTFVFNENIRLPPLNQEEDPALVRRAFGSRLKKLESQYPSFKHGFFSDIEDEVILLRFGKLIRVLQFTVKESQNLVLALTNYRKGGQTADRKKARSYLSAYVGLPLLHYRRLADIFQRVTFLLTRESEATLFSPETIKKIVQFFNKHGVDKVGECRKAAGINPIVGDHVIHDMYWQHRIIKNDLKKPLRRFTREESYYVLYKVLKQAKTYDVKSIESSEINWHKVAHKLARIPTTCHRHWETRIKPIILTHLAGEDCLEMSWKLRFYKQVYHDPKVFHRSNINCMDNDFLRTEKALQIERTMAKLPPLSFKESLAIFIKRFGESKNTKWDDYHLKHMEGIISCYGELKDTIDFEDSDDEGPDFTKDKVNDVVNDSSCSN